MKKKTKQKTKQKLKMWIIQAKVYLIEHTLLS